jgi:predicted amidohydrolase YtcJ
MNARELTLVLADAVHAFDDPPPRAAGRDRGTAAERGDRGGDAILVRNGIVEAVGPASRLRRARADHVLDLRGTVLTPGLADAHIHLCEWALARKAIDLSGARSPGHAARMLADSPDATSRTAGPFRGRGWNANRWAGEAPHRRWLDEALPADRPIALQSHDMHALWVNSATLHAAGIVASTPDPVGGRIERDAAGQPTGLLLDTACQLAITALPAPPEETVLAAVDDAQRALHRLGITAVHSFPGVHLPNPEPLAACEALRAAGRLRLRVLQHIRLEYLDEAIRLGLRSGFGGDWIRMGCVKMFLDGALGSRTAWMREPYETLDDCGIRVLDPKVFEEAVSRAAAAGIASTVHAIGDAAVDLAATVLARPANRVPAMPHRIEHVQCASPDTIRALAGMVCSVQPAHLITDWPAVDWHWGETRARGTYAFASLLRNGAILAFGSDAPVEPVDPRLGLHAARLRQDLERQPPSGWQPQERLEAVAAWHGYTTGPARAAAWLDRVGRIAPGCFADFAAWDRDPVACPADEVLELRCVATLVAGELVHS